MTRSFHISLFEGTLRVDKMHVWFKIANITHALPVLVYRQNNFTPKRVGVSRLLDTVARFRTGVKFLPRYKYMSRRGDWRRRDILWWYHVNKYKAMRGNWSELAPGRKSTPVSCRHPLTEERIKMVGLRNLLSVEKRRNPQWHVFMALSSLQTEIFLAKWQFFFQRSHLSLKVLVPSWYLFSLKIPVNVYKKLLHGFVSYRVLMDWFNVCRDIVSMPLRRSPIKLGGKGKTFEIDENKFEAKEQSKKGTQSWFLGFRSSGKDHKQICVVDRQS